jgi:hypothetical protein
MKVPSNVKVAALATAISAAPLAKSNTQQINLNDKNENTIEFVSEATQQDTSKDYVFGSQMTQTENSKDINLETQAQLNQNEQKKSRKINEIISEKRGVNNNSSKSSKISNSMQNNITQQDTLNNNKQFVLPNDDLGNEYNLDNYDINGKFIETSKDSAFFNVEETPDISFNHKGYELQESEYYDIDSPEMLTDSIENKMEKDKFTLDSLNNAQDRIFKEGTYLDKQAEAINKTVAEIGNETSLQMTGGDLLGEFSSLDNTISLADKKNYTYLHEKCHQINNKIIPEQFGDLLPDYCAKYHSAVDEAFAHSFSAAVYCKENRNMDLSDFDAKDHSTTIGKNLGLFLYNKENESAKFYREEQFSSKRNSKSDIEYQILSSELGISKVTGEQYMKYCVEKFSEFYGVDPQLIMKEVNKHKEKNGFNDKNKNLILDKKNELNNSSIFDNNKNVYENNGMLKKGDKLPIYLSPGIKRNIKELKEFMGKDNSKTNLKSSLNKELDIYSDDFSFIDLQYEDDNKNETLKKIKTSEKERKKQKSEIKKSGKSIPNDSKEKQSVNSRRENLEKRVINNKKSQNLNSSNHSSRDFNVIDKVKDTKKESSSNKKLNLNNNFDAVIEENKIVNKKVSRLKRLIENIQSQTKKIYNNIRNKFTSKSAKLVNNIQDNNQSLKTEATKQTPETSSNEFLFVRPEMRERLNQLEKLKQQEEKRKQELNNKMMSSKATQSTNKNPEKTKEPNKQQTSLSEFMNEHQSKTKEPNKQQTSLSEFMNEHQSKTKEPNKQQTGLSEFMNEHQSKTKKTNKQQTSLSEFMNEHQSKTKKTNIETLSVNDRREKLQIFKKTKRVPNMNEVLKKDNKKMVPNLNLHMQMKKMQTARS